jgi:DNA-directed RNA polymerase subunit RPC12/RpoP
MQCPRCLSGNLEFESVDIFCCPMCGFNPLEDDVRPENTPPPQPAIRRVALAPIPIDLPATIVLGPTERLTDLTRMRLEGRCQEAEIALDRGDRDAARAALKSALELYDLEDNLWLFLAGVAATREEQRDALEHALACNPGNPVAVESILRLDGRIDDAARLADARGLAAGQVAAQKLSCPRCGGGLRYNAQSKTVLCGFCGHAILDTNVMARSGPQAPLQLALLKRKEQPHAWNIGQRWVRCAECGTIITLSQPTLTNSCRFCGSRQVIQENARQRFEQPDLIVPFAVDEPAARAAIQTALRSGLRRITRLFADAVERIDLQGAYLPFWIFDAEMVVNWSWTNAPDRGQHPTLLGDVLFFGGRGLPRKLIEKIEPFDLRRSVAYDPRLLAAYPAELYEIDVDRASLEARTRLVWQAERRVRPVLEARRPQRGYQQNILFDSSPDRDGPGRLQINTFTRYMSYRFGLLPVWMGRLVEADGDTRLALVNGQTGEVAFGKSNPQQGEN